VECTTLDEHLLTLLDDNFTAEQIIAIAGTKKGRGKGMAYLAKALRGQRNDAAEAATPANAEPFTKPGITEAEAAVEAELRRLEGEIYDTRHLCNISGSITPEERDQRIADVRSKIRALLDPAVAAGETSGSQTRVTPIKTGEKGNE
jgi:hypothetical protein